MSLLTTLNLGDRDADSYFMLILLPLIAMQELFFQHITTTMLTTSNILGFSSQPFPQLLM